MDPSHYGALLTAFRTWFRLALAYVRSHTALLSTIQALAYGVYSRDADQYADRIKAFRLK